jgi:hypothetical protein
MKKEANDMVWKISSLVLLRAWQREIRRDETAE